MSISTRYLPSKRGTDSGSGNNKHKFHTEKNIGLLAETSPPALTFSKVLLRARVWIFLLVGISRGATRWLGSTGLRIKGGRPSRPGGCRAFWMDCCCEALWWEVEDQVSLGVPIEVIGWCLQCFLFYQSLDSVHLVEWKLPHTLHWLRYVLCSTWILHFLPLFVRPVGTWTMCVSFCTDKTFWKLLYFWLCDPMR